MTWQAMKLLGFSRDNSGQTFGEELDHRLLTQLYVALVTDALADIYRARSEQTDQDIMVWSLNPERIGRWFCESAHQEGHSLTGAYQSAAWMLRHLDALFAHHAAGGIVFACGERTFDATDMVIEALAVQRSVDLGGAGGNFVPAQTSAQTLRRAETLAAA